MRALSAIFLFIFVQVTYSQTYALKADQLIDGKADDRLSNPLVIIHRDKIVDIKFNNQIPDSAQLIDLTGYTLLPGLIDAHTHLLSDGDDYERDLYGRSASYRSLRAASYLKTSLENGFTTLRDVSTEGAGFSDVDLAIAVQRGFIDGPRIYPSTKGIAATGRYMPYLIRQNWGMELPSGAAYVSGVPECLKAVREQISRGASWIKVFVDWGTVSFTAEELSAILQETNRHGAEVAAHATSREGIRMAIEAGVKSIEHGDAFDDELIQMAIDNNVYWCPTISVYEHRQFRNLSSIYQSLSKAYRKGLKIVLATDAGSFPWTINQAKELEYYVEKAGFTPMDAIKSGTSTAAELLGRDQDLGQIQKGYIADIIAVRGDPLKDIQLLQQVGFVMKAGKIYKRKDD